ncbi:hypothetical protein ACT17_34335 [Mycolicibacterium conceptionense]|uniref:Uncharacterized protein n=1 Tax=Mycolicibacterium conceptionense TaxID=451644 RepID=A0A0J8TW30_9MYCO|nr:hypothetical protein [Mycolicibacterium conceptionense]KMV13633.1 hypothetical protein ACT17_34335 [Mycolicibacterium conceptionense]
MPRTAFEIKSYTTGTGDGIRLSRTGPFTDEVAAMVNERLEPFGADLVHGPSGWYLRSGDYRSASDANSDLACTLVLNRDPVGAQA